MASAADAAPWPWRGVRAQRCGRRAQVLWMLLRSRGPGASGSCQTARRQIAGGSTQEWLKPSRCGAPASSTEKAPDGHCRPRSRRATFVEGRERTRRLAPSLWLVDSKVARGMSTLSQCSLLRPTQTRRSLLPDGTSGRSNEEIQAMASIIKTERRELGDYDSAARVLKTIVAEHARTLRRVRPRQGSEWATERHQPRSGASIASYRP